SLEGAELRSGLSLEALVRRARAAHDVHTFEIGLQRQREVDRRAEMELVDQPRRISDVAARWVERIEHHRRVAEEDVAMAAHEVHGDVSHQDEEIEMPSLVLLTQEVE